MDRGMLEEYFHKCKVQFEPAFTIETADLTAIREDLTWIPMLPDLDGFVMQSFEYCFALYLLWSEVETITLIDNAVSSWNVGHRMRWKLKATPIYDGERLRMSSPGYFRDLGTTLELPVTDLLSMPQAVTDHQLGID